MDTEFLLPDGIAAEAAVEAVRRRLSLGEGQVSETERTFYDTFDGLLHRVGLVAVLAGDRLSLVELGGGAELASAKADNAPAARLDVASLQPGPLRDRLAEAIGVRALLPRARVRSRTRALDVLDDRHKIVVRLELEQPQLVASERRSVALRPRLRVAGVRGYDRELRRARRTLQDKLGFVSADRPLADEAVIAAGGDPAGFQSKPSVSLAREQHADAATVAVLRALLKVIERNFEGTVADVDAEFLHDFRVAVRRTRAVQRELSRVFPPAELARMRDGFRWLQRASGRARDLDVGVLEFDALRALVPESMRADLDPLLGVLRARRLTARRDMVRALRSEQTERLLVDWADLLERLVGLPLADRPDAHEPIWSVAGDRIASVYRRVVRMGRAIDEESPPSALHELRKQGKELRYLLELFGSEPLFPAEIVKPMVRRLKALQDVLGRHQDRAVQLDTLLELRDEVSALPGGASALMAMGVLVQRLGADQQAARSQFAVRFAEFSAKDQRRAVKETFA